MCPKSNEMKYSWR